MFIHKWIRESVVERETDHKLVYWRCGGEGRVRTVGQARRGCDSVPRVPRLHTEEREKKHPEEIKIPPEDAAKGQPDKSPTGERLEQIGPSQVPAQPPVDS